MEHHLSLVILDDTLAVCRLAPKTRVAEAVLAGDLSAVIYTPEEVTLICRVEAIPEGAVAETDWRAIKVEGTLDFSLTGVLVSLALPLSQSGVSIFASSTYQTDYVLVKQHMLAEAVASLRAAGHTVKFAAG